MRKWMLVNVGIVDIIDIVIFKCIRHVLMSRCIDPIKTTPKDLEMIWILWLKHMMDTIASLFLPTIRFGIHVSHRLTHIARQLFAIQYHIDNECTKQYQIFFPYLQHRPHSAGALLRGGGVNGRGFCLFASHSLGGYTILYVVLFEALFGAVSGLLTKHINRPCILFHWK